VLQQVIVGNARHAGFRAGHRDKRSLRKLRHRTDPLFRRAGVDLDAAQ
jgi:hypothetical protein